MSDDGSGKGAALIAIVADRFQKNQLRSFVSVDETEDEVIRQQFQQKLITPISPIPQSNLGTLTRTLS